MLKEPLQKKTCRKGHTFYKLRDCPTCLIYERQKPKTGIFAEIPSPVRGTLEHAYIRTSGKKRIEYNDAVEETYEFGWINSTVKSLDVDSSVNVFLQEVPKAHIPKQTRKV